jgi:hypothetical protein
MFCFSSLAMNAKARNIDGEDREVFSMLRSPKDRFLQSPDAISKISTQHMRASYSAGRSIFAFGEKRSSHRRKEVRKYGPEVKFGKQTV